MRRGVSVEPAVVSRLIAQVRPDVLVKGGDYKTNQIVGREHAGRVARISLVKGRSSTDIIARVLKVYGGKAPR